MVYVISVYRQVEEWLWVTKWKAYGRNLVRRTPWGHWYSLRKSSYFYLRTEPGKFETENRSSNCLRATANACMSVCVNRLKINAVGSLLEPSWWNITENIHILFSLDGLWSNRYQLLLHWIWLFFFAGSLTTATVFLTPASQSILQNCRRFYRFQLQLLISNLPCKRKGRGKTFYVGREKRRKALSPETK